MHPAQDILHHCHTENGKNQGYRRGQNRPRCHGLAHGLQIPRPIVLRRYHRKSGCKAKQEPDDQKHQRPACAHGCQSLIPHEFPYNHRICHAVELLEYISDKNRNRKIQYHFPRLSRCHFLVHLSASCLNV